MRSTLLIPPEFTAALDAHPDDFTLRLALADWFAERGMELEAECMWWSVEKGRSPKDGEAGWHSREEVAPNRVPITLREGVVWNFEYDPSESFDLLIRRWLAATPEVREECWKWQPPSRSPSTWPPPTTATPPT